MQELDTAQVLRLPFHLKKELRRGHIARCGALRVLTHSRGNGRGGGQGQGVGRAHRLEICEIMAVNGWQAVLVLLEGLSEVRHLHSAAPVPVKCIEDRLDQEDVRLGVPGSESGERGIVVVRVSGLCAQVSGAKRTVLPAPRVHFPSSLSWLSQSPSAGSVHCVSPLHRHGGVVSI